MLHEAGPLPPGVLPERVEQSGDVFDVPKIAPKGVNVVGRGRVRVAPRREMLGLHVLRQGGERRDVPAAWGDNANGSREGAGGTRDRHA